MKNTPIVLLDEATAALDSGEPAIRAAVSGGAAPTQHLIVIAHKPPTVTAADQILVLNDARRIAGRGGYDELVALGGRYSAFWRGRSMAAGWRLAPDFVAGLEVFPPLWLRLWAPHPEKAVGYYASADSNFNPAKCTFLRISVL